MVSVALSHRQIARSGRLIARLRRHIAGAGACVTLVSAPESCLRGQVALARCTLPHITAGLVGSRVATAREVTITGRLITVGRHLVAIGARLVALGARLIDVRERLVDIGERLLSVSEGLLVAGLRCGERWKLITLSAVYAVRGHHRTTARRWIGHNGLRTVDDESRRSPRASHN